jgi:TRAP-type C4-dicarboxylate transport system permease small subunit
MLSRIDSAAHRLESWCAILLLAAIVALVALASLARAVGSPIIWSVEVAQLLFVWLCILAADLAMQKERHFGLSFLLDSLSPKAGRRLAIANHAVLAVLLAFLLVYAFRNTILMHPRLVGATQMHGSWIHASMVVGFALLLRTMLVNLWRVWTSPAADRA